MRQGRQWNRSSSTFPAVLSNGNKQKHEPRDAVREVSPGKKEGETAALEKSIIHRDDPSHCSFDSPQPLPQPQSPLDTSMSWQVFLLRQGQVLVPTGLPHFLMSRFPLRIQQ